MGTEEKVLPDPLPSPPPPPVVVVVLVLPAAVVAAASDYPHRHQSVNNDP